MSSIRRSARQVDGYEPQQRRDKLDIGALAAIRNLQEDAILRQCIYTWSRTASELYRRQELELRLQVAAFEARKQAGETRKRASKGAFRLVERQSVALMRICFVAWP